jgi:hypothetical protein
MIKYKNKKKLKILFILMNVIFYFVFKIYFKFYLFNFSQNLFDQIGV